MEYATRWLSQTGSIRKRLQTEEQAERIATHIAAAYRLTGQDFLKQLLNQESPDTLDRMMRYHRYFSESRIQAMAEYRERLDMKQLESAFVQLELFLDRTDRVKLTRAMLKTAVRDVYGRGREVFQQLEQDPDTEHSQGLRLEARYLWHQLRMLEHQIPEDMQSMTETLAALGELLTDDNNMAVLAENLRTRPGLCCNRVQAELLDSLAETRRIALLSGVLRRATGIYQRTPDQFVSDLFPQAE